VKIETVVKPYRIRNVITRVRWRNIPTTIVGRLSEKALVGTTSGPDGALWQWTGERAPSLTRTGDPKWRKPTQLFNGRDLSGWRASDPTSTATWKVENGTLVSPGHGPELISDARFEDFKLHVELNCAKGSNSGVYLRGRYELQIEDDPEAEGLTMRTGRRVGLSGPPRRNSHADRENGRATTSRSLDES